jgi:hypothetical protein
MATSCIAGQAVTTVLADPDLLAMEFEAIIAANFPPPGDRPARRPPFVGRGAVTRVERPGTGPDARPIVVGRTRAVRRRPHPRERSPPTRTTPDRPPT